MILTIRLWPDPVLGQPAEPVGEIDDDIRRLAADMLETMYDAPGRGLAAPQVGVGLRMFVMDTAWKDGTPAPRVVIDPVLSETSETAATHEEGCLSIPGILAPVARPAEVTLSYRDLDGLERTERLTGFDAVCAQHEYDHLDGRVTFDRLNADLRARLEAEYAAG